MAGTSRHRSDCAPQAAWCGRGHGPIVAKAQGLQSSRFACGLPASDQDSAPGALGKIRLQGFQHLLEYIEIQADPLFAIASLFLQTQGMENAADDTRTFPGVMLPPLGSHAWAANAG